MKKTIILVLLALCLAVTACAETAATDAILGTISGDTYENTVLGFSCTLEGWHYYSEEEIATVNQLTKDHLTEDFQKLMELAQPINIMVAQNPENTKNVNVQIQNVEANLPVFEAVGLQYLAEASLPQFKTTLESAGFTDADLSVGDITVGGRTMTGVIGSYTLQGFKMYFKQPWILSGSYLATMTVTSVLEDTTDEILANFTIQQEEPAA